MFRTLVLIEDNDLENELFGLNIWNKTTGFELTKIYRNLSEALRAESEMNYNLVISQIFPENMDILLNDIRTKITANIILLSNELTLENARICILNRVNDFFVLPFDKQLFKKTLLAIAESNSVLTESADVYANELARLIDTHDPALTLRIDEISNRLFVLPLSDTDAGTVFSLVLSATLDIIFDKYDWLDLYFNKEDFMDSESSRQDFITMLNNFAREFFELFPAVNNDKIQEVVFFILNNPESDLKQKNIATDHYMNSSFLSTIFTAHTQQRFVDYLTNVKLRRAAWLIRNTPLKVVDICSKLDYKDMGYFSKIFKKKYGITPSQYRIPDNYEYFI